MLVCLVPDNHITSSKSQGFIMHLIDLKKVKMVSFGGWCFYLLTSFIIKFINFKENG